MFRSVISHFFKSSRFTLDNLVFRLHYRVTVGLLLFCAIAVLWKITLGVPIRCLANNIPDDFANDHCWYNGLFKYTEARGKEVGEEVGEEVSAPGIDMKSEGAFESHNVHRWVVVCFMVQALFFYLPRLLWKCLEGRKVHRLIWNIRDVRVPLEMISTRKNCISNYLRNSSLSNMVYAFSHLFCEFLNFINVVVQLLLVNQFAQVSFVNLNMMVKSRAERDDPLALEVFPMFAECSFEKNGPNGEIHSRSITCILSVNGVIETLLICQWIWFALLAVLSALALVYHVILLVLPQLRSFRLEAKTNMTSRTTIENVTRRLGIGEWFVLYMLSKNMDPIIMRDIIGSLAEGVFNKDEGHVLSTL